MRAALADPFAPVRVVVLGNSANNWPPLIWRDGQVVNDPTLPDLAYRLCVPMGVPFTDVCVDGTGWVDLMADDQWKANTAAQPRHQADTLDVAVLNGGQPDVWYERHTPAEGYAFLVTVAEWCRSVGFDRIVIVTSPALPTEMMAPDVYAEFVDLYATDPDHCADSIARADLTLHDNTDLRYRQSDLLHMNPAGANLFADTIRPAVYAAVT